MAQGKLEAARDEYEAALVTHPRYAAALKQLGGVQLARRQFAAAETALVAALEQQPGFTAAWADLGATRRWLGDLDGAVTALQFAAFQTPDDTLVHWTLAHVLVREKSSPPPKTCDRRSGRAAWLERRSARLLLPVCCTSASIRRSYGFWTFPIPTGAPISACTRA